MSSNPSLKNDLNRAINDGLSLFNTECQQVLNVASSGKSPISVDQVENAIAEFHQTIWGDEKNPGLAVRIANAKSHDEAISIGQKHLLNLEEPTGLITSFSISFVHGICKTADNLQAETPADKTEYLAKNEL